MDHADLGKLADRQGALAGVQGPAPPRPGVSTDLARKKTDPADQQSGRRRPPVRAVLGDSDLRTVHLGGRDPITLAQAIEDPPQRGDPPRADGEPHPSQVRGAGQLSGEVTSVRAQPDLSGSRGTGQRHQRAPQQLRGLARGVLITGHQIRSKHRGGLRPARHMRAPTPLPLVVNCHTPLLAPVHLHLSGIQIDRRPLAQRRDPRRWQRSEHRGEPARCRRSHSPARATGPG